MPTRGAWYLLYYNWAWLTGLCFLCAVLHYVTMSHDAIQIFIVREHVRSEITISEDNSYVTAILAG